MAHGHREHTQDGGKRRHQDRAQTALRSHDGCLAHTVAPFLQEDGIVNQHDTVLYHDTQQDDDTYHGHQAEGHPVKHGGNGHAHKGERDREHDHERTQEGLKLRCHHHIYQDDDEQDQQDHIREHILLVFIVAANRPTDG